MPAPTLSPVPRPVPADRDFSKGYSSVVFFFFPRWMNKQREAAGFGHIARFYFIKIVPSRHLKKKNWIKLMANCLDMALIRE